MATKKKDEGPRGFWGFLNHGVDVDPVTGKHCVNTLGKWIAGVVGAIVLFFLILLLPLVPALWHLGRATSKAAAIAEHPYESFKAGAKEAVGDVASGVSDAAKSASEKFGGVTLPRLTPEPPTPDTSINITEAGGEQKIVLDSRRSSIVPADLNTFAGRSFTLRYPDGTRYTVSYRRVGAQVVETVLDETGHTVTSLPGTQVFVVSCGAPCRLNFTHPR